MNAKGQEGGNAEREESGEYTKVSYKGSLDAWHSVGCISGNTEFIGHYYSCQFLSCSQNLLNTSDAAPLSVIDIQRKSILWVFKA